MQNCIVNVHHAGLVKDKGVAGGAAVVDACLKVSTVGNRQGAGGSSAVVARNLGEFAPSVAILEGGRTIDALRIFMKALV